MPHLAHFAINADDVPRAKKFYEKVFGWKFSAWGPPNFYQIQTGKDDHTQPALGRCRDAATSCRASPRSATSAPSRSSRSTTRSKR